MTTALRALDELRRVILTRGTASDPDELCLAATISCVHKHLRDRNRKRCTGLLRHVDPATLTYTGFEAVWELGMKTAAGPDGCAALGGAMDMPIADWTRILDWHMTRGLRVRIHGSEGSEDFATDAELKLIAACPDVRSLDLFGGPDVSGSPDVSDQGIISFAAQCKDTLIELSLENLAIGKDAITAISACTSLWNLTLRQLDYIDDECISLLAEACPLILLELDMCEVTDQGMLAIAAGCPMLESLELAYMDGVTEMGLTAIVEGCVHLTDLSLQGLLELTNDTLVAKLAASKVISHLSILYGAVSFAMLQGLSASASLERLGLQGSTITDDTGELPSGFGALRELSLCGCKWLTDDNIKSFGTCTALEGLDIANTSVSDAAIRSIAEMWPALTNIDMEGCKKVTDPGLVALAACDHLVHLKVAGCSVTDRGLRGLARSLRDLEIER